MEFSFEELKKFVFGLGWFGKEDLRVVRFPSSMESQLSVDLWENVLESSGVRIRFKSRCETMVVECSNVSILHYTSLSIKNQRAFDLYEDGKFYGQFEEDGGIGPLLAFLDIVPNKVHEYEIYFPYRSIVDFKTLVLDFEVEEGEPALLPPSPFALPKPIVYYGSSITHGDAADRPGLTYPAIIGRRLNLDFINLGFGGTGLGEPEVAKLMAELSSNCFVLDWGVNLLGQPDPIALIKERYENFYQVIRKSHPDTPIVFVNLQCVGLPRNIQQQQWIMQLRTEILRVYGSYKNSDSNLGYIDALDIIGSEDGDLTHDLTHPNTAGMLRYADALTPLLKDILKL